jgi:flagellar hook-associated protein 1 FlgK
VAGLIGIGQSALAAAYAQLQTTGHNIANVNTPGYVRQEVILETAGGMYTGAGFIGRGVNVAEVARRYDQFIGREVTNNTSLAAGDAARAQRLVRLDDLLANTDDGLGAALDHLRSALADLVNRPGDASTREVVMRRADALAEQFRATSGQLRQLGSETDLRIAETANQVNGKLEAIADLNHQIAATQGSGKQPSDLLDQRDKLIDEVSGSLQLSRIAQPDGTVNLYSASGHALVLGRSASKLVTQADPLDPGKLQVSFQIGGTRIAADASTLGTGELAGLVRFRDQDLAAAQARVGQLAAAVAGAYNQQQAAGVDADGNAGAALFALPTVDADAAPGNSGNAALAVTVGDATQLRATDYRLSFDGSQYRLESLADGKVAMLDSLPADVDGLQITLSAGGMTIGDRFTIKGASSFAEQMRLGFSDGRGLAAADPSSADPAMDNRNARKLAGLGDEPRVNGATFTDAFAALVADVGSRTLQGQAASQASGALLSNAKAAFAAESGVNLDEEAARLLQYQQAYQAASRVIATANTMFDTILSVISR